MEMALDLPIEPGTVRVAFFIDCKLHETMTSGTGPASHGRRHDDMVLLQESVYTG